MKGPRPHRPAAAADLVPANIREKLERGRPIIKDGVEWRAPTGAHARHASTLYGPLCEHPKSRSRGTCGLKSVGEFDIPETYKPPIRHLGQPDIRRPRSFLCRQHSRMVAAFASGRKLAGNSHEAWCDVCNHPDKERAERVVGMWVEWALTTDQACVELGISHRPFYSHVGYFDLYAKKSAKVNVRRALVIAAERGFSAGGHSIRTGLKAIEILAKERGEPRQVDVNVKGAIGIGVMPDLTKLTDGQLAEHFEQLARQIRENGGGGGNGEGGEERKQPRRLPAPPQTIDLPRSSIKDVTASSKSIGDAER